MAGWAGWGPGPAGAGSSGGPSRRFLGVMLAVALVTAASAAAGGRWLAAALLRLLDGGAVNGQGAKIVLEELFRQGGDPEAVVRARGLAQVSDQGAIETAVDKVLAASPGEVERYRGGNKKLLGFFVGGVMKELRGKGNPAVVNALLRKKLGD